MEIRHEGGPLSTGSARERFVLATLLLNADRLVLIDRLVDGLWRIPPRSAKAQLHNLVSKIRARLRGIDDGLIVTRPLGYELVLGLNRLDLAEFRRLAHEGRKRHAAGDHTGAATVLHRALELWRGPALADIPGESVGEIRAALEEELLAATETKLDADLALGCIDDLLRDVTSLLDRHPYREDLYRRQMVALVAAGRRADALAVYQAAYRRFVDDLGVEPGTPLRDLQRQIVCGEPVIEPPTRVVVPRQLPPMDTRLTGRDALLARITGELDRPDGEVSPVVALVGPGGVGKTMLALAAGHRLEPRYPDGQLYADLRGSHADPADPYVVAGLFLRALGVNGGAVPDDATERIGMYRSHLAAGRVLVVLDDAADEAQIRPLLPGAPRCAALVTCRRQLRALMGVMRLTVPTLATADGTALLARLGAGDRVIADHVTAARIVEACGGLPLAVCIAAARLALRPDWELADFHRRLVDERVRLDELAVGDLDVRANLALSFQSLSEPAQTLFRLLGLVTTRDLPAWVADLAAEGQLAELIDAHLVELIGRDRAGQPRYRLHDLVAEYAAELGNAENDERERDEALDRVLRGWLTLASQADGRIASGDSPGVDVPPLPLPVAVTRVAQEIPYEWFEAERASLVDAVELACRFGRADIAGDLALRLSGFLAVRGYDDDRERTLRRAVECVRRHGPVQTLGRLLSNLFEAVAQRDRRAELSDIAREALAVSRRVGDPVFELRALAQVARAARMDGRFNEARWMLEEAVSAARRAAVSRSLQCKVVESLGVTYLESGDGRAVPLLAEAVMLASDEGKDRRAAQVRHSYALALIRAGRLSDAEHAATEGLIITETIGDEVGTAYLEQTLAMLHLERRQWADAAVRLDRSLRLHEQYDNREGIAEALRAQGDLALGEGRADDALPLLTRSLELCRQIGSGLEVARVLCRLELGHAAVGDHAAAGACRAEWQAILDELRLAEICLGRPRFLECGPH